MQKLVFRNANGIELDLTSDPFGITEWAGFSADELNVQSQQVPFQDGAVFLDALLGERELSVTVAMQDNNNLETRYQLRREMISKLNPKLGEGVLIYTNDYLSKQIHVIPQLPVFENHNSNDSGTPKASCTFTACNPYWEDLEDTVAVFNENQSVEILNEGDIPCGVEIDINTVNIDSPVIKNMTNDKLIRLSGLINSDVNINTNTGKKTVTGKVNGILPQLVFTGLSSVFYVEKVRKYFAFGDSANNYGYYVVSDDGENWRYKNMGSFQNFAYSDILGYFICVTFSDIRKSYDGENWEIAGSHSNFTGSLSIDWSDKLGIFLGANSDNVCLSTDGIIWHKLSVGFSASYSVQWVEKKGKFFISQNNSNYTYTYDGVSFEQINLPTFTKIKYIEELNLYITQGWIDGKIRTSADGITWNSITITNLNAQGILWTGEKILVSGYNASEQKNELYESTDGATFTYLADTDFMFYDGIETENGFVAVGNAGLVEKSTDGENWEVIKYNPSNYRMNEAFFTYCDTNHRTYALFIYGDNPLLSTINGTDWEIENPASHLQRIEWIKEKNLFVGFNGSQIVSSTDGITWTNRKAVTMCGNFCYSKTLDKIYSLYLTYNSSSNKTELHVLTSTNGTSWTDTKKLELTGGITAGIDEIAYSEVLNIFLAYAEIGETKYLFKSTDGNSWTSSTITNTVWSLFRVDRDGYFYYCHEKLYRSTDGTSWEAVNLGNDVLLKCGCFSEELGIYCLIANYIGSGYTPACFYSPDGANWERKEYRGNGTNNFAEIIYSPYSFKFITGNTFLISASDTTGETENLINLLSQDSDIGFNFDVGNNKIVYTQIAGKANVTIKYRQKYVGV